MHAFKHVLIISLRDYVHEYRLSLCAIAALTAVLTPLLVLFGLKHGIVTSMLADLRSTPQTRLVQPLGQGQYDSAWLDRLRARPEVDFLVPTTRYLSATIELGTTEQAHAPLQRVEMWPTGDGDPLWSGTQLNFDADRVEVVISRMLAQRLQVAEGDLLQARIGRTISGGERQGVRIELRVAGVLAPHHVQRDVLLVPLEFLESVERYREGRAVPLFQWPGGTTAESTPRNFASFRLYARSIDDVAPLRDHLATLGVDAETAASQIEMVRKLERALNVLFLILSGLASIGYAFSMTLNLIATVERKQQDLSVLKMLGFGNGAVAFFPVSQGVLTALLGCLTGFGLYVLVEPLINHLFADSLREGQLICALAPAHFLAALALSMGVAVMTALFSGSRAAAIQPAEGLRHE